VASEEASEVLGAQLGLQPGDGLVVVFVEPDSPAARAGLQKHDVMVEFGDQLLVHPAQFRKLVRRQKEGDKIKLTFYRSGKKQSVSATLAKTFERVASLEGMNNHEFQLQFSDPENAENVHGHLKGLHESLAQTGLTRKFVNVEVQRGLEQARKAIRETLSRNGSFATALGSDAAELEALTRGDVEKSTTVTVNKNAKSVKTMVKADDTGTYVLVANPKRRLTVHGKDGKLLFDGEVETKAQQEKVPEELRSKAQRMLKEMGPVTDENARPEARSAQKPKG
jgi:membrane-associated protease RseP (regulator of RpoE activity)